AGEHKRNQERGFGACLFQARQGRGSGAGHKAPRPHDRGGTEGVPDRDSDPLGIRRGVRRQRSESRPVLARQRPDALRRRCERADTRVQGVPREPGEDLMAAVLTTTDVWADRRRRVAQLRSRHGYARQLLDFYGALLDVQETSFHRATQAAPDSAQIASFAAEVVAPNVIDVSVAVGPERMRSELIDRLGVHDERAMIETWMRGDEQPLVERFLARATLGPVLEALPEARAACGGPRDGLHCPE